MEESVDTLTAVRRTVKQSYPEGDMTRTADLFWRQNSYELPTTKMDHHIDRMSENMIDEYVTHGRLVDINDDDRHTAILLVHFTPNAYLISCKTIAKLTVLSSNSQ